MPVIDMPVHDKTKQGPDARYGCHNRPAKFKDTLIVKDGWVIDPVTGLGQQKFKEIPNAMSNECRYDGAAGRSDKGHGEDSLCQGCCHYKVSHYVQKMNEEAAAIAAAKLAA